MNHKAWYAPYMLLFFLILISTTLFLFSGDNSKSLDQRVIVLVMNSALRDHIYPIQAPDLTSPNECINNLLNNLRSGNLDLKALQDGIDKCFGLSLNGNGGNNTPIVPQPPSGNSPRFV